MPDLSFHVRDDVSCTGSGDGRVYKCESCHELMPCSGHKNRGQRLCASINSDFSGKCFLLDHYKRNGPLWLSGLLTATVRLGVCYIDWRRNARSHVTYNQQNANMWCIDRPEFYPDIPDGMVMVTLGYRLKTQGAGTVSLPLAIPADKEAEMREKIVFPSEPMFLKCSVW